MRIRPFLIALLVVGAGYVGLDQMLRPDRRAFEENAYDPLSDPKIIESQAFLSSELACALVDYRPVRPFHCLIIPKRRVVRFEELTGEELVEMGYLIRRTQEAVEAILGPCDYLLLQKNGPCVGQTVAHVHWHFIPRPESETSVLKLALSFIWPFHSRLGAKDLAARVDLLRKALDETEAKEI